MLGFRGLLHQYCAFVFHFFEELTEDRHQLPCVTPILTLWTDVCIQL